MALFKSKKTGIFYDEVDMRAYGIKCEIEEHFSYIQVHYFVANDPDRRTSYEYTRTSGPNYQGHFSLIPEHILWKLGFMKREFIQDTYLGIGNRQLSNADLDKYEEAELTIQEMYELGDGADLSKFVGKRAKGGRYLITGNRVNRFKHPDKNKGHWEYSIIEKTPASIE